MSGIEELQEYPSVITLPVLWGDQDLFGHVNNTVSFRWFESSRIAYFNDDRIVNIMQREAFGPILAHINCNFRRQINFPDQVSVGASVTRLGRTSITMKHAVFSHQQQAIVSDGDSVIVAFNYKTDETFPIPDDMRVAFDEIEGRVS